MKWWPALALLAGCAASDLHDLDAPQDADEADGKLDGATQSCTKVTCGNPDAENILFPGNPACAGGGCERNLASDSLYIPPTNGTPFGTTYAHGVIPAATLAGYSSGRIALLRRLALVGDGIHAVMLDPSWVDGARDFAGRGPERGEDIVHAWLVDDPERTFTLIYSRRSVGWSNYAALAATDVGDRVQVCAVDTPHLLIPQIPGLAGALSAPWDWDNGTCEWGTTP